MKRPWIALVVVLAACSDPGAPPGLNIANVSMISKPKMNLNSALTVDFVVVYDQTILKKLQGMTATQYFSSIDQLRRDSMSATDIWRWELIPDQILESYHPVYTNKKAWGGLVFADYQTPGDHRIGLGTAKDILIVFGEKDIESISVEDAPDDINEWTIYPVNETVVLNTRTPASGLTDRDDANLKQDTKDGGTAQKPATEPTAAVKS